MIASNIYNRLVQELLNHYAKNKIPVLFILDFELLETIIIKLEQVDANRVLYDINGIRNYLPPKCLDRKIIFLKHPISIGEYEKAFYKVQEEQKKGNSYLVNLTFPTKIETNLSLKEIFYYSKAKYKLFYDDKFVVFSPEQFVVINDRKISTFPMKGTIDASVPNAVQVIMADEKEHAEHITVVDLLRNDLGIISNKVRVKRFRYIDKITTLNRELLQVSSEICGQLEENWYNRMGDILYALLPAGSVTGAPKKKTVEIIKAVENYKRGYYTGIFGYFDGKILDSAVMIRFIEKQEDGTLIYKSGGGITIYSDLQYEYNELVDKVYVPIAGNNKNKE